MAEYLGDYNWIKDPYGLHSVYTKHTETAYNLI